MVILIQILQPDRPPLKAGKDRTGGNQEHDPESKDVATDRVRLIQVSGKVGVSWRSRQTGHPRGRQRSGSVVKILTHPAVQPPANYNPGYVA